VYKRQTSPCVEPMLPKNVSYDAGRFPMYSALPSAEYYQPV